MTGCQIEAGIIVIAVGEDIRLYICGVEIIDPAVLIGILAWWIDAECGFYKVEIGYGANGEGDSGSEYYVKAKTIKEAWEKAMKDDFMAKRAAEVEEDTCEEGNDLVLAGKIDEVAGEDSFYWDTNESTYQYVKIEKIVIH